MDICIANSHSLSLASFSFRNSLPNTLSRWIRGEVCDKIKGMVHRVHPWRSCRSATTVRRRGGKKGRREWKPVIVLLHGWHSWSVVGFIIGKGLRSWLLLLILWGSRRSIGRSGFAAPFQGGHKVSVIRAAAAVAAAKERGGRGSGLSDETEEDQAVVK